MKKIIYYIIALALQLTGFTSVIRYYDWELALGIFLIIWGNNYNRKADKL